MYPTFGVQFTDITGFQTALYIALHHRGIFNNRKAPLTKGAFLMCIVFYTVNPEPPKFPKSFIVRIFKDDSGVTRCLKTVNFPIFSPDRISQIRNAANEYGRLSVREIISKEVSQ